MRVMLVTPEPATEIKPRVFRFAQLLSRRHEVHLVYVTDIPGREAPEQIRRSADSVIQQCGIKLHELSGQWLTGAVSVVVRALAEPLRPALYDRRELRKQIDIVAQQVRPDVVHIDRERAFPLAKHLRLPKVLDLTDPIGWYLEERAGHATGLWSTLLRWESRRMWEYERLICKEADAVTFASQIGCERFSARVRGASVEYVPNPLPRPAAVSQPITLPGTSPHIIISGNLYYPLNVQSISWFVRSCWPTVKERLPNASLHLAGSRPHKQIVKLESRDSSVWLHANPVDMTSLLRAADVALAPLLLCAGFPNKIVDAAISGGLPVVASRAAIEGLPDMVRSAILEAQTPEEWSSQLEKLLTQEPLRQHSLELLQSALYGSLDDQQILEQLCRSYEKAVYHSLRS